MKDESLFLFWFCWRVLIFVCEVGCVGWRNFLIVIAQLVLVIMKSLEEAIAKIDAVILKRLRFVLKFIKAVTSQPNTKNRQASLYFVEVFDALGDWSGDENEEMAEMIDRQLFPCLCRFIATFSPAEFDSFQYFLLKYTLGKWKESPNFVVLEFISDIYGFVTRLAPEPVTKEYLELFSQKDMPPQISLVILPAIRRNVSDISKSDGEKLTILSNGSS